MPRDAAMRNDTRMWRSSLRAGIEYALTVNVQHLESLNDLVASITGIAVGERIPDHVFDSADQSEIGGY